MLKDLLHILRRYKNVKELSDNNRILKITVLNGDCLNQNAFTEAMVRQVSEYLAWQRSFRSSWR